ncbi:MAG: geranylgeranyl reductase family protein [Candidatus Geothermincolia bacterium]
MKECDVLVIGAGPGGWAGAHYLAPSGVTVLVVDRATFPREKVCGDGITPRCTYNLYRMGLRPELEGSFMRTRGIRYYSTHGGTAAAFYPLGSNYPDHGYVVPRRELDALLVRHVREAGVEVLEGCEVTGALPPEEPGSVAGGARATLAGRDLEIRARYIIAADGPASILGKQLGLVGLDPLHTGVSVRAYFEGVGDLDDLIEIYPMDEILPACGWIFPLGDGRANVGVGAMLHHIRNRHMNLNDVFKRFIGGTRYSSAKLRDASVSQRPHGGIMRVGLPAGRQLSGNVLLVGDAAGMTNPMTGEGIANALESGRWAAGAVRAAFQTGRLDALQVYPQMLGELYGRYYRRGMRCIRYGAHPAVIDPLVFGAAHSRRVAEKMSRYLLNIRSSEMPS